MSPVIGGSKVFWTEFIKTYESLPALWDVKSDSYKNRNLKNEAYGKLVVKLREIEPNANREVVRRKINSLRCSYRRELNKIRESYKNVTCGDGFYYTSLWYFKLLGFLKEHESSFQTPPTSPDPVRAQTPPSAPIFIPAPRQDTDQPPPAKIFKPSHPAPYSNPYPSQYTSSHENQHLHQNPNISSYQNPLPPPHQNRNLHQNREQHICSSCPCIAAQESEYDKIGKAWASELQKMNHEQQIYAKRAIAEILFEGQLSALHRDSVTINHMNMQPVINEASPPLYRIEKEEPVSDS